MPNPHAAKSRRIRSLGDVDSGYAHIYLSPHFDDAALCCGGRIAGQTDAHERVLVVTVCAAAPPRDTVHHARARELHRTWNLADDEVVPTRRREDAESMAALGAHYLYLDFLDQIYRLPEVPPPWSRATPDRLAPRLAAIVATLHRRCQKARFYAPLGIGHHPDHLATYDAAEAAQQLGAEVVYYEDFPYVNVKDAREQRLGEVGVAMRAERIAIDPTIDRKCAAIAAYASQLGMLFGEAPNALADQVADYGRRVGAKGGSYGEQVWRPGK